MNLTGCFVYSKAGHDKNKVYIVVSEEGDFVYLSDGEIKKLNAPKKKRLKHIQPVVHKKPEGFATDEEIKRSIKLFLKGREE